MLNKINIPFFHAGVWKENKSVARDKLKNRKSTFGKKKR